MCDDCRRAKDNAMRAMIAAFHASGEAGAIMVAKLVALSVMDERATTERRYTVDQIMLDSYETQRRDAIVLLGALITGATMIKGRLLEESVRAGDKGMVQLEWDAEKNGFHMTARDAEGNPVNRFEAVAFGESPAQAMQRIMLGHLDSIGEIHG